MRCSRSGRIREHAAADRGRADIIDGWGALDGAHSLVSDREVHPPRPPHARDGAAGRSSGVSRAPEASSLRAGTRTGPVIGLIAAGLGPISAACSSIAASPSRSSASLLRRSSRPRSLQPATGVLHRRGLGRARPEQVQPQVRGASRRRPRAPAEVAWRRRRAEHGHAGTGRRLELDQLVVGRVLAPRLEGQRVSTERPRPRRVHYGPAGSPSTYPAPYTVAAMAAAPGIVSTQATTHVGRSNAPVDARSRHDRCDAAGADKGHHATRPSRRSAHGSSDDGSPRPRRDRRRYVSWKSLVKSNCRKARADHDHERITAEARSSSPRSDTTSSTPETSRPVEGLATRWAAPLGSALHPSLGGAIIQSGRCDARIGRRCCTAYGRGTREERRR